MKDYQNAVFIGRFQPFHAHHKAIVEQGLEIADRVIILVGSATAPRTIKNPFSFNERSDMIWRSFESSADRARIEILPLRDYFTSMDTWLANVQAATSLFIKPGSSVALLGTWKDNSSYYLKCFPQWDFTAVPASDMHASRLRKVMYEAAQNSSGNINVDWEGKVSQLKPIDWGFGVPENVEMFLKDWMKTPQFAELAKEWQFNEAYKASWASAPFPPTFVTADAVVVASGHVLVVKRKFNPGKGLYALPGGFIRQDETIQNAALRELKEETGIRVDKVILESSIEGSKVFDYPDRSLRGRTITHAFYIKLKDGVLPEVAANDDASQVFWMPLYDVIVNEQSFFEDHVSIVQSFTNVGA